jgi:hypothetical protein
MLNPDELGFGSSKMIQIQIRHIGTVATNYQKPGKSSGYGIPTTLMMGIYIA